jgi:t-SNARE complex subunit (syntaxin)
MITKNTEDIHKLKANDRLETSPTKRQDYLIELQELMTNTGVVGIEIKRLLDEINAANVVYIKDHPDSAKTQIRVNLYQTHVRNFHKLMNAYNATANDFKMRLQDRIKRELKVVDDDLTDEQIEEIVESGQADQVIQSAMISENLLAVVQDIHQRHLDILKLEQSILELYELVKDFAALVDLQQESLDVIENRVINSRNYVEKGHEELVGAEKHQMKARKKECCLLCVGMAILVAVLVPVLSTQLKDS